MVTARAKQIIRHCEEETVRYAATCFRKRRSSGKPVSVAMVTALFSLIMFTNYFVLLWINDTSLFSDADLLSPSSVPYSSSSFLGWLTAVVVWREHWCFVGKQLSRCLYRASEYLPSQCCTFHKCSAIHQPSVKSTRLTFGGRTDEW